MNLSMDHFKENKRFLNKTKQKFQIAIIQKF